jgi:MFS transporter, putative metabolite:H+ symporter
MQHHKTTGIFSIPVLVAALGYFVDIYDLLLFTIVREPSLAGIGIDKADTASMIAASTKIINWQMIGLLIGGILWGILGDKKGRLSVLFGSIMLYSAANFATGFIETVPQYALARFIAGIGLAGELGAGITLVSELLPKEKRGGLFYLQIQQRLAHLLYDRGRTWSGFAHSPHQCCRKRHVSGCKGKPYFKGQFSNVF